MSITSGYEAALGGVALFPDMGRAVVEVTGSKATRVINGLTSNAVDRVKDGAGAYSFLLDRKGRVVVDARVLPAPGFEGPSAIDGTPVSAGAAGTQPPRTSEGDETLWLDVPAAGLQALEAHLATYVPPIFARYRTLDVQVISLVGPGAKDLLEERAGASELRFGRPPEVLGGLGATTARAPFVGAGLLVGREEIEGPGFDVYVARDDVPGLLVDLRRLVAERGGAEANAADWGVLRIERGIPLFGAELGPDRLAQESGQDARAISFEKGCFTGQEVVARIHYRGHVNRHLRGLRPIRPRDSAPAAPPTAFEGMVGVGLELEGKTVGTVTSTADSPRFGPIALAYVRREVEPGTHVSAVGAPGPAFTVLDLPFT